LTNCPQEDIFALKEPEGVMKGKLILRVMILLLLSLTVLSDSEKGVRKE
jgi:hypothetical protein